jgi:hypothetical protein
MGITIGQFIEIIMAVFNTLMEFFGGLKKDDEATETPEA